MPPRARILVAALVLSLACDEKGKSDGTKDAEPSAAEGKADSPSGLNAYMLRSKTSEARVQVAKLFDSSAAYFMEEHVERGATLLGPDGSLPTVAPHQCPNDGRPEGSAGITPPLSVDCNAGPKGRCIPVEGEPSGPGEYSIKLWTDNPVWEGLNFMQEQGHYFHYDFRWKNDPKGFGSCELTVQAFGDLDDDDVFSTFERTAKASESGIDASAELRIEQEIE